MTENAVFVFLAWYFTSLHNFLFSEALFWDTLIYFNTDSNKFICAIFTFTKRNLNLQDEIRCFDGYPERNAGKRVTNAEISGCSPDHNSLTNVLLSILIILMIGVGILVIYYHRQKIHSSFKPLVVSFHKSMQYRTIDKEEEPPSEVNV